MSTISFSQKLSGTWLLHYVYQTPKQQDSLSKESFANTDSKFDTVSYQAVEEIQIRTPYHFIGSLLEFSSKGKVKVYGVRKDKKQLKWKVKDGQVILRSGWKFPKLKGNWHSDSLVLTAEKKGELARFYFYKLPESNIPIDFKPEDLLNKTLRWSVDSGREPQILLYESTFYEMHQNRFISSNTIEVSKNLTWGSSQGEQLIYNFSEGNFYFTTNPSLMNPTIHYLYKIDNDTLYFMDYGMLDQKPFKASYKAIIIENYLRDELKGELVGKWQIDSIENQHINSYVSPFELILTNINTFELKTTCFDSYVFDSESKKECLYSGSWELDANREIKLFNNLGEVVASVRPIFESNKSLFIISLMSSANSIVSGSLPMLKAE
jgi:hypothetical protein